MPDFLHILLNPRLLIYSGLTAVAVVGLAKSWQRFKDKYAEKIAAKKIEKAA